MHDQNSEEEWQLHLRNLYARRRNTNTTLGIAMALIAMIFIAGIVTAFIHAADNKLDSAQIRSPSPVAETTGSGSTSQ